MKLTDLKPFHVYELSRQVVNPKPDRRVNSDTEWNKWPVLEEGMRFQFIQHGIDLDHRVAHVPTLRYFDSRHPNISEVRIWEGLDTRKLDPKEDRDEIAQRKLIADVVDALVPSPVTVTVFFASHDVRGEYHAVLETMLRTGIISWQVLTQGIAAHKREQKELRDANAVDDLPPPIFNDFES